MSPPRRRQARPGTETAYRIGYVAGREASAIGVNWMFNPVADVYKNWRNTIVNTRSFGSDPARVTECVRAYIRGIKDANPNMACTCKHFPGDGWDELDPHLSPAHNEATVEDWMGSYGLVYRTMIDEGLEAVMTGQISLPAWSRRVRPGIRDEEIMPASLAPELLQDLLRGRARLQRPHHLRRLPHDRHGGRHGAQGRGAPLHRRRLRHVPLRQRLQEDLGYLHAGYEQGIVTEERLSDALHRVLGLKAHLKLYDEAVRCPDPKLLDEVGCEAFRRYTAQAADRGVTLVKDTRGLLPIDTKEKNRALLIYVRSTPNSKGDSGDGVRELITQELEAAGFAVTQCPSFYDRENTDGVNPMNFVRMMMMEKREDFRKKYDVVFVFINVKGYAQRNVERMSWSSGHSMELPWYTEEVPTVGVSLNYTNHLIGLAQHPHLYQRLRPEPGEHPRGGGEDRRRKQIYGDGGRDSLLRPLGHSVINNRRTIMKAVIFDLDGVICFTDKYHYQAWKALADRLGIYFDEQINNRLRGVSRMASLDIILERARTTRRRKGRLRGGKERALRRAPAADEPGRSER